MIDDSSSVVERMFLLLLLSLELAVIVKVINFDQKKKREYYWNQICDVICAEREKMARDRL
jgi:hypothetical protein